MHQPNSDPTAPESPALAPAPVVVGYDGLSDGLNAISWALEELPPETPIVVVTASGGQRLLPLPFPRRQGSDELRARLEALWMEDADVIDAEVELRVEDGSPAEAVLRVAEERGARMIVLGHHQRGRSAVLHASVAHVVIERSRIPVVVVP